MAGSAAAGTVWCRAKRRCGVVWRVRSFAEASAAGHTPAFDPGLRVLHTLGRAAGSARAPPHAAAPQHGRDGVRLGCGDEAYRERKGEQHYEQRRRARHRAAGRKGWEAKAEGCTKRAPQRKEEGQGTRVEQGEQERRRQGEGEADEEREEEGEEEVDADAEVEAEAEAEGGGELESCLGRQSAAVWPRLRVRGILT
eukprot:scaffold172844_cov31-Tisochrysis_lutea.AAC.5